MMASKMSAALKIWDFLTPWKIQRRDRSMSEWILQLQSKSQHRAQTQETTGRKKTEKWTKQHHSKKQGLCTIVRWSNMILGQKKTAMT